VRRFVVAALSLPLMALGVIVAHWVAYLVAVPDAGSRRALLAASGHAYVAWAPTALGLLAGLAVLLLGGVALRGAGTLERVRLRPGLFLCLPPVAFAVQEHAERLRVGYDAPYHVWQEPTFWRGLLLQLPFGVVAYLLARLVLRVSQAAEAFVARRRAAGHLPHPVEPRRLSRPPLALLLPLPVRAGDALAFRGPPRTLRGSL
jgi:hypothetical protein